MQRRLREYGELISRWLLGTLIVVTPIIGVVLRWPANALQPDTHAIVKWFTNFIQAHGAIILIILGVLSGIAKLVAHHLGQRWAWDSVDAVLDQVCEYAFERHQDDLAHHNRVTLFKHVGCKLWLRPWRGSTPWGRGRWPFSGWLVPIARSGHATQRLATVFLAPDDADEAEGIAGKAWATTGVVEAHQLPDLSRTSGDHNVQRYARRSYTPRALIDKRLAENKPLPRALTGIPVYKGGKPWGVVVLDSRRPKGIRSSHDNASCFGIAQNLIEKLVRAI